jgi:hypothetical protein
MTYYLNELSTYPLLLQSPNWSASPKYSFLNSLSILSYSGTNTEFYENTERKPQSIDATFSFFNKQEEYYFRKFWIDKKGMLKKFWLTSPPNLFTLKEDIGSTTNKITIDRLIYIYPNDRIYIQKTNGDFWTHKVATIERLTDTTELTLSSNAGIDILRTDILNFGLLLLCRFNKDVVSFKYTNYQVSDVGVEFQEVLEYD